MIFKKLIASAIALLLIALLLFTGCLKQEIKSVQKLTIQGFGQKIELGMAEIKEFPEIKKEVNSISSDDQKELRKVKGVYLEDILKNYFSQNKDSIASLRFYASDGYSIEVPGEVIKKEKIILAYEMDGEPLEEWEKPLRAVVPNQRTMYWVKNLVKIGLGQKKVSLVPERIIFIDTLVKNINTEEYEYYGKTDKAVTVKNLLCDYNFKDLSDEVLIKSSDGFEKTEKEEIFNSGYIKISGENSPTFLSDDLPKGMWIKDILWFLYEKTVYLSCPEGLQFFENAKIGAKEGIAVDKILDETKIKEADVYIFTASDGFNLEIDSSDLDKGIIYLNNEGELELYFKNLGEGKILKNILLIETK